MSHSQIEASPRHRAVRSLRALAWDMLPARWRGRLDSLKARHYDYDLYDNAMNGQAARMACARQILSDCAIRKIVETGTHRGATTAWFATFGLPVTTVEINPEYAEFSRVRLKAFANIELRHERSIDTLRRLAAAPNARETPTFFYLDAHWNELPLREEIEIVAAGFPKAVIMIDDFEVPGDPGYGYDDYGPENRLSLGYLHRCKTPPLAVYFPSVPAAVESGVRRGSVTVTADRGLAAILDRMPMLRRWMDAPVQQNQGLLVRNGKTN